MPKDNAAMTPAALGDITGRLFPEASRRRAELLDKLVGAAMCPACLCGTVTWPLAIMLSAEQDPVKSTPSRTCTG